MCTSQSCLRHSALAVPSWSHAQFRVGPRGDTVNCITATNIRKVFQNSEVALGSSPLSAITIFFVVEPLGLPKDSIFITRSIPSITAAPSGMKLVEDNIPNSST